MKKFWKIALVIAGIATLALGGCVIEEEPEEPAKGLTLGAVRTAYATVSEAKKIEERIEIKSGALVQYTEERAYTLSGDAYTVTGTTARLNTLDADEAYTETTLEAYTVEKSEAFAGALGLADANVEKVTATETELSLSVKAGKEKAFFALEELKEVSSMKATFTMAEAKLGEVTVSYVTGTSTVTVTLSFTY